MLKTASIFKDFYISANATNTAVTFEKNGVLSVSVKNDNFAQQVQILDNDNNVDFFAYKYITFDDSAVFEITDCIRNGKYVTLFIQYLSNITFDAPNDNFRIDAVSINKLRKLGINATELLTILGNETILNKSNVQLSETIPFIFAVKVRMLKIPDNLKYRFYGSGNKVIETNTTTKTYNRIYNQTINDIDETFPINPDNYTNFDNAITLFLPLPSSLPSEINFNQSVDWTGGEDLYRYTAKTLVETLSLLITDLTLSMELTIMTINTLQVLGPVSVNNFVFDYRYLPSSWGQDRHFELVLPSSANISMFEKKMNSVRVFEETVTTSGDDKITTGHPIFIIGLMPDNSHLSSFFEAYDIVKVGIPDNDIYTSLYLFNNKIDLTQMRENYFYIKRKKNGLSIIVDKTKNLHYDIYTNIEFAKNSLSNFEAYQRSNVELINNQNIAMSNQHQQQQREIQTFNSIITGAKTIGNAAFAFGMGNTAGGIGQIVGGVTNIITDNLKLNMQQQNEKANLKLSNAQAIEKARGTYIPTAEFSGTLDFGTAFENLRNLANYLGIVAFSVEYLNLNSIQKQILQRHIFDNVLIEKINDINQIVKPVWADSYYQAKICNRSHLNTRKDLIIYVEDEQ